MNLFSGFRERYDKAYPPAPRPTHLEAPVLTKGLTPLGLAGMTANPAAIVSKPVMPPGIAQIIPDSVPTFDAAHPYQLDGLWWTPDSAAASHARSRRRSESQSACSGQGSGSLRLFLPRQRPRWHLSLW